MKKGTGVWCLIAILAVVGSALSGAVGAADMSAADSAVNITEEINNVTNATISNLNETVLANASSIYNESVNGVDSDGDGISDYDEIHGFTWVNRTYFTNPYQTSTDRDPYDDYMEITGIDMSTAVIDPGRHPCVPSSADLKVKLEGVEVVPKCKITSTETKEEGESWYLHIETEEWTKAGVEAGCEFTPFWPPFFKAYGYAYAYYESYAQTVSSTSGWSREEWSKATAVDLNEAAKLKFHLRVKNEGTDAAKNVKLRFNVIIGEDKIADTVWTDVVEWRMEPGDVSDEMVIDHDREGEIVVTLDELKSIELGAPVSIKVTEVNAEVPWEGGWITWDDYKGEFEPVSSTIMADFGDGDVKEYKVWSGLHLLSEPPHLYIHNVTINDAIDRTIGIKEKEDGVYIGWKADKEVKLENWTFGFDNESFQQINETLGEEWTLYDLLNVTIKQGWIIVMKSPDIKPPDIHWASYSSDMKTIKASVSDNENIESVTAYVKVAGDYRKFDLTDEDHDLIYSVTLPLGIQDIGDDYIEASDGKFTSKFDGIFPPMYESVNVTDLILEDNESYIIKDMVYEVKNVTIKDNARLTVKNATLHADAFSDFQYNIIVEDNGSLILDNGKISTNWIVTPMYCINYSLYFNETEGEGANKTVNGNISRSELVNASGIQGVYANYTVYIKGEDFSASTKEQSITSKAAIEPEIDVSLALQKYTCINVSNLTNVTINVTTTVTYISRPCKIELNLSDNASFATKNDSEAVIYKINSTGQPEIKISESDFENLTAINGKADVIIAKSYMGDLEKLSAKSVNISDSEIKKIGDDGLNYGDPGEDASISIYSLDDVYISNTSLLAEGGDGKEGYDGGVNENGGNGGEGGNASISIGSDMDISIINSSLSSTGGNAGNGGDGADDVCWSCWPGNGGNGGYGGASLISLRCKSLSIINSSTSNAGGNAGNGGNGGDAGLWGDDGDGGDGGDGGYAPISFISDARESFIKNSYSSSKGGNKGNGGWGHHYGDEGYLGDSSISFTSKTLTTLDSNLQSIDYNGDSKISYMTFDCYTNLVNTTYTPFSVTSGNRVNICYWLTTNVTDEVEKPIENARVKVTEDPSDKEVKTDYTDKKGILKMYLPSNITTTDSEHTAFVGNYFVQAFKNGYESDKESISVKDNLQISLIIIIPKPIVSIYTDKDTYGPYEQQNVSITVKNPADILAMLKLGIGFKIYEIGGKPYEYEIPTLRESDLFELPADFEWEFNLTILGLGLPNGKYAWTAYLKDDKGEIISRDEAVFDITGKAAVITPEEITRKIEKLEVPMFNIG